jgi:uncharacterized iron-regulated membrane protein
MNAMRAGTIRVWRSLHTWTSLICTVFLLMLCLTGLPLVFGDELNGLLRKEPAYAAAPADAKADLGRITAAAQAAYPNDHVRTVFLDANAPQVGVIMTPKADGPFDDYHELYFDARTGDLRVDDLKDRPGIDIINVILTIHANMFAGLFGEIFLGLMAIVFLVSLVSGAILYAPFMRKLGFGQIRTGGSGRVAWLDLHNLVGVAALVWMFVVGATGVMNAFATPLFGIWQMTDVKQVLAPYNQPTPVTPVADLQKAVNHAEAAVPGAKLDYVTFPATFYASPVHYVVWLKGDRTLTSRMETPVLVNAITGKVDAVARMPWYLKALEISRPLHFGDYGGMPLKVLWAVLDIGTIAVLITGLYLWVAKRRWSTKAADLLAVEAAATGSTT